MKLGQPRLEATVSWTVIRVPLLVEKDTRVGHEPVESRLGEASDGLWPWERYVSAEERKVRDFPILLRHVDRVRLPGYPGLSAAAAPG
jgi:hypothetical protein